MTATETRPEGPAPKGVGRELAIGIALIVLGHGCDLWSTYLACPDLSRESSPLYLKLASLGLSGWPTVLWTKAIGALVSSALFGLYLRNRRRLYPDVSGQSFHDFLHATHSRGAIRRRDGSWVAPSPALVGLWLAYVAAMGSAAYALFLSIHNIVGTPWMERMAQTVAPGAIFIAIAIVFWRGLYRDYCSTRAGQ